MDAQCKALLELGQRLRAHGYRFVSVTPRTHDIVRRRPRRAEKARSTLRDVFGWSAPFRAEHLPVDVLRALREADACEETAHGWLRSRVRYSSVGDDLFVHSAHPTVERDAVFFGPDTYRFCSVLDRWLVGRTGKYRRMVDVGCGTGVGGIFARRHAEEIVLADVNRRALAYAGVNAALADATVTCRESDVLSGVPGAIDAVIANPPYLCDERGRTYRDGGGRYGEALSLRIVDEALDRLEPGGVLVVYTGTAIVDGVDIFRAGLQEGRTDRCGELDYAEVDPDVFGEELEHPPYDDVDRIAAVALRAIKR